MLADPVRLPGLLDVVCGDDDGGGGGARDLGQVPPDRLPQQGVHPNLYSVIVYCTVLYCTVMYFTVLYYTVLYTTYRGFVQNEQLRLLQQRHRQACSPEIGAFKPRNAFDFYIRPGGQATSVFAYRIFVGNRTFCTPFWVKIYATFYTILGWEPPFINLQATNS